MSELNIGDSVIAHYKSGSYIGKITEDRDRFYLVEVLAVEKHPMQGDLHNPGKTEDVFFHERKALSHHEKANISKSAVKAYDGEIPDYEQSLRNAVNRLKERLERKDSAFNQKALDQVTSLEKSYFG
ncbi:kinase-associated lipoprotein B [Thalassobacillus devorans]|uniref:Kinase-associated lipoprotein B n=1 Tax=Thalassobacillus devorans TaxID=279813 RepID=A0ABQ1NN63_9BACI|nr:kinase-associated lipoprotein B [Thalassobacillus devorans]NIK29078.1 kinase-associated protein B [Thalassobacillus devorans]GGC81333.1 kinase-associated lipoprotein B [Thalassobacillus devorans]